MIPYFYGCVNEKPGLKELVIKLYSEGKRVLESNLGYVTGINYIFMSRSHKKIKYRRIRKEIISKLLETGGTALEFAVFLADRRRIGFDEYRDIEYQSYYHSLRRLERNDVIRINKKRNKLQFGLTRKGLAIAQEIVEMRIKPVLRNEWDGYWRLVAFDIPESQRSVRDVLRRKIKELGFLELQKSLFVMPWSCREQIAKIQELYQADRYIKYLEVTNFDGDQLYKKKFNL